MIDTTKLRTVAACDKRLVELRRRWMLLSGDRARWGVMDDIDLVLERRLHLTGLRAARAGVKVTAV